MWSKGPQTHLKSIPRRRGAVLALLSLLLAAAPAAAVAVPDDPDAVLVDELVVTARRPGPAWWRVTRGDSTVYVLGTPSVAPKHMAWDQTLFNQRLAGASQVILPFNGLTVHLAGAPGALFSLMRLRAGRPFEEGLDPAGRARFARARALVGQPAQRYKVAHPLAAGLMILGDYRDRNSLTSTDPTKLIRLLAERSRIPVKQRAYDLGPLLGAVIRTPPEAGRTCLDETLTDIESGPAATLAAARAWAGGDVAGALAAERTYERCLAATPGALAFDARVKADTVRQIELAMKSPGHAVAVVQLRPLLSQGGVLDRLRADGYTVATPAEE